MVCVYSASYPGYILSVMTIRYYNKVVIIVCCYSYTFTTIITMAELIVWWFCWHTIVLIGTIQIAILYLITKDAISSNVIRSSIQSIQSGSVYGNELIILLPWLVFRVFIKDEISLHCLHSIIVCISSTAELGLSKSTYSTHQFSS